MLRVHIQQQSNWRSFIFNKKSGVFSDSSCCQLEVGMSSDVTQLRKVEILCSYGAMGVKTVCT